MTFESLQHLVLKWSHDRRIIEHSTSTAQLLKAVAEMGELADAQAKNDEAGISDGVGDVLVCLINFCAIRKIDLVACLNSAYDEIKDRKGTMLTGGVFVKE